MRDETLAKRNVRMAWNLLMPTLAILVIVAARPLEKTFITSLTDKRFAGTEEVQYVAFDNYSKLLSMRLDTVTCRVDDEGNCRLNRDGGIIWQFDIELARQGFAPIVTVPLGNEQALILSGTDSDFIQAIFNTIQFTVVSVSLELVLGLFIALVVNSKFRGRGFIRAVMLVPWAIPTVISARLWELMLRDNQSGIINKILIDLGLQGSSQAWLSSADLQINALIMVDVWKTTPFMALLLLAGLQLIPEDLYEAAAIDGASRVQQFFTVTLPLLRPTIAIALVFRSLDALRAFDVFQVLLGRQKLSMATYNYEVLIQSQQAGYASAVSVIIFVLISIFTITYVRSIKMEGV
ncbi:MAG: sugar ABC transporter permease [Anaerolineae bacterium]|nr:sugar ABC transporter permease [Anaerolineae bacterium]